MSRRLQVVRRKSSFLAAVARRADELVRRLTLLELDRDVMSLAAAISPPALCSLDAIHLASALSLGSYLEAFVTYDARLAEAAVTLGARVLTPR